MLFVSYVNSTRPTKRRKSVNKLLRTDNRCVLFLVRLLTKITVFGMNNVPEAENAVLAQQRLLKVTTSHGN